MWLHSLKVAQLLRSAACLHTNQPRSYLNHLVNNLSILSLYVSGSFSSPRIEQLTSAFLTIHFEVSVAFINVEKSVFFSLLHI